MFLRLTEGTVNWWARTGFTDPWLLFFFLFATFVFGSCIGSFLNVCIWRIPLGESVADAPSHCPKCGRDIRWFDNIPLVSFLLLGCRCRYCREPITWRYFIVEGLTGILFAGLLYKVGVLEQPPATLAVYYPMVMLCITTAWIDTEHRIIPDLTTYSALVLGGIAALAFPSLWGVENRLLSFALSAGSAIVSGGFLWLFRLVGDRFSGREVIGLGDVKFLAACGVLLGPAGAFFVVLAGSLAGCAGGIASAVSGHRNLRSLSIAFGPYLAGAALVWMFAGEWLLRMYLSFCVIH